MRYTVVLLAEPEEGGYSALVPALPGCVSFGESLDEALAMIQDAAEGYLSVAAERGEVVLEEAPGTVVAAIEVAVPAPLAEAVASTMATVRGETAASVSDEGALLARRLAARFADLPPVAAVALGGSTATGLAAADSDLDLYVYALAEIPVVVRAVIAGPEAGRPELDQRFWEPGDTWLDPDTGRTIDVMYRDPGWIEDQLARVLLRHEASIGYSTALWWNVLTARPLFDRDGWFARLQGWADQPYPEPLRRAIVAKNHPLLRDRSFAFLPQIEAAGRRRDAPAVHHRLTAFLASYFDVLFALNRVPHPGEKRMVEHALASCPLRPDDLAPRIDGLLAAATPRCDQPTLIARLDALVDDLARLLDAADLRP